MCVATIMRLNIENVKSKTGKMDPEPISGYRLIKLQINRDNQANPTRIKKIAVAIFMFSSESTMSSKSIYVDRLNATAAISNEETRVIFLTIDGLAACQYTYP